MIRLLPAILIVCSFTAPLSAQASKGQASKGQASKDQASQEQAAQDKTSKDGESAGQAAAAPTANTQFPLDAFPEFSAIMVGSMMTGDDHESHIYRSGKLLRNEGPQGHNFIITDLTTGETFGVSAPGCIHDSHPYLLSVPFAFSGPGVTAERTAAGEETVDGHSCKIENVTVHSPKFKNPMKLRLWEAEDLQGFPVKVAFLRGTAHNPEIHYKNVVLGPQDPTLFIYPKSCEKSLGYNTKLPGAAPKAKKPAAAPPAPQN